MRTTAKLSPVQGLLSTATFRHLPPLSSRWPTPVDSPRFKMHDATSQHAKLKPEKSPSFCSGGCTRARTDCFNLSPAHTQAVRPLCYHTRELVCVCALRICINTSLWFGFSQRTRALSKSSCVGNHIWRPPIHEAVGEVCLFGMTWMDFSPFYFTT